jgi:hypothetical protein
MGNHAPLNAPTPSRRDDGTCRTADPAQPQQPSDQAGQAGQADQARQTDQTDQARHSGQAGQAGRHLTAIAARLTARGIVSRLTRLGGTPVLTIDQPTGGPYPVTVTVDPGTGTGSGVPVDCTCLWTPAPGTTPEATADTIVTVLNALRTEPSLRKLPGPVLARSAAARAPLTPGTGGGSGGCWPVRHRPFGRKVFKVFLPR